MTAIHATVAKILTEKQKCQPHGGARGEIRGSSVIAISYEQYYCTSIIVTAMTTNIP